MPALAVMPTSIFSARNKTSEKKEIGLGLRSAGASQLSVFSTHAHLEVETVNMLAAFSLGTWFSDALQIAPNLSLCGPEPEVSRLLRLLNCTSRHPLLLGNLDLGSLAGLPSGLTTTLLIGQRILDDRLTRVLLASNRRRFRIVRGNGEIHSYGAKAFSGEQVPFEETAIRISVGPELKPIFVMSDEEEAELVRGYQARLLRYRFDNLDRVRKASTDLSMFVPELREQAHAWLAPAFG